MSEFRKHSRARSTKTRIETPAETTLWPAWGGIREQDPLKQGLKQELDIAAQQEGDSRARSTKTRIETTTGYHDFTGTYRIREQDPLKQGLKHQLMAGSVTIFETFESKIH